MDTSYLIRDMPLEDRPRERLLAQGADQLNNAELLAILLRVGTRGSSAVQVAQQLLKQFGSLGALVDAPTRQIAAVRGVGVTKAVTLKAAFKLAQRLANELQQEPPLLDTPERIADWLRESYRGLTSERASVVLLNTRRRLIKVEKLADGSLDSINIHARDVFRPAMLINAAAVVLVHNHPSGDPTPSESDVRVTRELIRAGQLMRLELVDHVILGRATEQRPRDYISLRELGYFCS